MTRYVLCFNVQYHFKSQINLIQILLQEQGHGHTIKQTHLHVLVINSEFGKLYNTLKSCLH